MHASNHLMRLCNTVFTTGPDYVIQFLQLDPFLNT